jgi:hypothetical protein
MPCTGCNEKDVMPWMSLYRRCWAALEASQNKRVDVSWMMAICIMESGGSGITIRSNAVLRENGEVVRHLTNVDPGLFFQYISIKEATNRGFIPKFRMEGAWFHSAIQSATFVRLPIMDQIIMTSSWGIAQQGAPFMWNSANLLDRVAHVKEFMLSEPMQLQTLSDKLRDIEFHEPNKGALRFTRYNAGMSAQTISKYGLAAANIADGFSKNITQKGLKTCLV